MEGNTIDRFLHRHPLTLIEEEVLDHEFPCRGCEKSLSPGEGPICGCGGCKFYLHKSCAELPKEIHHFFHPCPLSLSILSFICNACFKHGNGFTYRCERCNFDMHLECAQRPINIELESDGDDEKIIIQHFTHWHPLTLLDEDEDGKKDLQVGYCGICDQKLICSAAAYGCEECEFFVHKSCIINIPRHINNHSFHPSCPLILLTTPFSYMCPGCDDKHASGSLVFRCGKCRFQLDVKCALLPTLDHSKDIAHKIQYLAHNHPLVTFRDTNKADNIITSDVGYCRACRESCSLESSTFGCERCEFVIHRQCAVEFKPEIHHYFHPLHPLTLSSLPIPTPTGKGTRTFSCDSCLGSIDEFLLVYRCDKCDFNLHVDCSKPKRQLVKYEGHSHHLTFFDKTHHSAVCDICYEDARNCFFRCVACEFDLHLHCHPSVPDTIKPKCHLHPLTLTESPFEYEYESDASESDDEFYCDVCEEKRFKKESVYYCKECKFIAETRCVISELLPSVTDSEVRANSADEEKSAKVSIADLENKMAELTERKNPLKLEVEKLKATLKEYETELESISEELNEAKKDHFLLKYQLDHYLKEKQNPTDEASTSKGSTTADQS